MSTVPFRRRLLAQIVDLRDGEGWVAAQAFASLFGIIAAHTMLETARDALFLGKLPARSLALVYVLLAGLALLVAAVNTRFVRAFGRRNSLIVTLMGCAYGTIIFHFLPATRVHVFALYVWSALLGTVLAVQFWMFAGQLFTVGQGKRLFGLIAAGGVLGAVVGAGIAAAALEVVPVQSLLLVSAGLFLATAVWLTTVMTDESRAPTLSAEAPVAAAGPGALAMFREVPYLWGIAGLVALSTAAVLTTDYLFKSIAPGAARSLHLPLGVFFGRYYATLNAASLVVQVLLAGRLLRRLGVAATLTVLPLLLLAGGVGSLLIGGALLIMLTKGADGALRYSLHRVSTELTYLPLASDVRDRAKSLIDSSLSRGVQAITAAVILLLSTFGLASSRVLAGMVVLLSAGWLVVAVRLRRPYLDLFRQALRKGSLDTQHGSEDLDLSSVEAVMEALSSPDTATVLAALDLLEDRGRTRLIPGLILYHESDDVLLRALEIAVKHERKDWTPLIQRLLGHASEHVRVAVVRAMRDTGADLERARNDPSPAVRAHVIFCILHDGDHADPMSDPAMCELMNLGGEEGRAARVALLDAIRDHAAARWADAILQLSESEDDEIVEHAAQAMAAVKDPRFIPVLIARLTVRDGRGAVRTALVEHGDAALEALEAAMRAPTTDPRVRRHIPRTISRFGSQRAADILAEQLRGQESGLVRYKILRGLGRLVVESKVKVDRDRIEAEMRRNLVEHLRVLSIWLPLDRGQRDDSSRANGSGRLVLGLLDDKVRQSLERAFRLLQIAHKTEDIRSVYVAARSDDRRARANALEFLDALIVGRPGGNAAAREENRTLLRLVVDDLSPGERVERAAALIPTAPGGYEDALRVLLGDRDESLAALAGYHAMELGFGALRGEVEAATRARPALGIAETLQKLIREPEVGHA